MLKYETIHVDYRLFNYAGSIPHCATRQLQMCFGYLVTSTKALRFNIHRPSTASPPPQTQTNIWEKPSLTTKRAVEIIYKVT